ncbi:hypothetical protein O181_002047 [Austropuccinia psidii MF-1]|uniref:Uncharacterized protein n=1 Tax=Austropuccinia psidii MF-1 TaxID=1389203 RepID=A0A9Q3BC15_9BASI|nr:hypothetical protein [Austropuccinia psidii MF-1]
MAQFSENTKKDLDKLKECMSRLQEANTLKMRTIHTLQKDYKRLSRYSEEIKSLRDNITSKETQDQNIVPKTSYCPYKEKIKKDSSWESKHRSPSQYQDGDNMTYLEKEALKNLTEATNWPNFSGVRECDHMELVYYIDGLFIDVPNIPDYWITARLNKAFKGHASIWYMETKKSMVEELNNPKVE